MFTLETSILKLPTVAKSRYQLLLSWWYQIVCLGSSPPLLPLSTVPIVNIDRAITGYQFLLAHNGGTMTSTFVWALTFSICHFWTNADNDVQERKRSISENGIAMFCWGRCSEGQLGLGEIEDENILSPRNLQSTFGTESEIKDIVCGWEHTAVLKKDGVVYTCGSNENGQLGHNKDGKKFGG